MGYTQFTKDLVYNAIQNASIKIGSVLDFGACLDYSEAEPTPISEWYESMNIKYLAIDLAGDNNALQLNWAYPLSPFELGKFNLIVDAGSSEHSFQSKAFTTAAFEDGKINSIYPTKPPSDYEIQWGYYECWCNKHNLLEVGGIMVNENPMTHHWPDHSFSYLSHSFYQELAKIAGYEVMDAGIHFACGNTTDGGNVYSILRKTSDLFPSFEEFYEKLPIYRS